ncbi:MAG: paraquat-inducible protein A [Pseudomonadota bacterium]|nr:paraquat-inducible protein A [Pseudomonadota bacterium]
MTATASRAGLLLCEACYLLNHDAASLQHPACVRCGATLFARKPASLVRGWAFLIAACILYVPANLLPVMESGSLFESQSDTIMSGIVYLWKTGSWLLAVIVFVASIVIPAAKLSSLGFLLLTAQRRSTWRPEQRARLFRATHYIGRWSMVDIYVGATLVAMVQLKAFGSIEPGPGAVYFMLVVILTMFSSLSFDPRLTWDPVDDRHE